MQTSDETARTEHGLERTADDMPLDVEEAVRTRYSAAAQRTESQLCCPVEYRPQDLAHIPQEILERDYGCGDPSRFIDSGETVLDLGSGGGKMCYIAAAVVGREGRVIGVDANDEMLELARKHRDEVGERLGYRNVEFRKGKIQDLRLDLDRLDAHLAECPVSSSADWLRAEALADRLRQESPSIADDSIDVTISNCVLNLVRQEDRRMLFAEIHRVLKPGGRAVISDIVSDEDAPAALQADAKLWSGCISGAFREDRLLAAFEEAGFYGIEIVARQTDPWAVVEGIEFRSLTVRAYKGQDGPSRDEKQAVIYNGPWKAVIDDEGHRLERGARSAVCARTFAIYTQPPYAAHVTPVPPATPVVSGETAEFSREEHPLRDPRETKAGRTVSTELPTLDCCSPDGDCC